MALTRTFMFRNSFEACKYFCFPFAARSLKDYSSGGALMAERNYQSNTYRNGFNGKQKDDEINGAGNYIDYGMRGYDPRLVRLNYSIDPLSKKYPELSPYQFANNTPIQAVDLDGLENIYYQDAFDKSGFSSSNDLRLSTAHGIKEQIKIYQT